MFECTLFEGDLFKKLISALSELVSEGNFLIDGKEISFQGMDSSHVSLVSLSLRSEGFEPYRCDRDLTLGINFGSLNKILKCMANNDRLSIRAEDNADSCFFIFESNNTQNERISTFELKLMDIDAEQMGIPETEYDTSIQMPSSEFLRICRDLSSLGDSIAISVNKEGVKFSVNGDVGSGEVILRGNCSNNSNNSSNNNNSNNNVKTENIDTDEISGIDVDGKGVTIRMEEPITQTFALRYLNNFTKATSLSSKVTLSMGSDVPLLCEYKIGEVGVVKYFLAPKIDDE